MEMLWCWRCEAKVPMLDEGEFDEISKLYSECAHQAKQCRLRTNASIEEVQVYFRPMQLELERITGVADCDPHEALHHRLSRFGPLCNRCGKPLRSPDAKRCVERGTLRENGN